MRQRLPKYHYNVSAVALTSRESQEAMNKAREIADGSAIAAKLLSP